MSDQWIADYSAYLDVGMALSNQGLFADALAHYDAAIAVNPNVSVGYINRFIVVMMS